MQWTDNGVRQGIVGGGFFNVFWLNHQIKTWTLATLA